MIFQVKNLKKSFGKLQAVKDISFEIKEGTCFGLLGPNGAGKSTTIECIQQIIKNDGGEILFDGEVVSEKNLHHFGIQFQDTALPHKLKVREVLEFFRDLYGSKKSLEELIRLCHLGPFLEQFHDKISGGQRQRLLLAVSLCHNPRLLMLDEPTTGLDPQARRNLWGLVKDVLKTGTTVILTTHYMDEAFELCDEIGIMDHGELIAIGEPKELLKKTFEEIVLEVPFQGGIDLSSYFNNTKLRDKFIEVTVTDLNGALAKLAELNLDLSGMNIRQKNLEDLFIHLTGQDLRG